MTKLLLFLSVLFLSIPYLSPGEDVVDGELTTSFEYTVEIVCVSFLVIFGINYFTGKLQNEKLALAWATKFATKDSIFDKNFSLLGVGETEGSPLLLKEGQAVFKFYASGRRYCQGLLATMELKSRHDLISRIYNMIVPCRDEITFEVYMNDDAMDNVVFAVAEKKAAKAMQKEERDLHKFATMVSQPNGRKWVAEELGVVSESKEVAGDLVTEPVLDLVFGDKAFEEFGKGFISMHFSDQHIGPQRKMLLFKFALPDANNMADMTQLVALVLYYIDLIGLYKLNPQARSKTEAARTKAAQEVYKELQHARQEALQNKKAMKKRLIEDAQAKLSAGAVRKREGNERAHQMKKTMLKMKMTRAHTNEAESMNLLEEDLKTKATESVGTGIRTTTSISTPETSKLVSARKAAAVLRQQPKTIQMHTHQTCSSLDKVSMLCEDMVQNGIMDSYVGVSRWITEYVTNPDVGKIAICGDVEARKITFMQSLMFNPVIRDMFDRVIWVDVTVLMDVTQVQMEIAKRISYRHSSKIRIDEDIYNMLTLRRLLKQMRFLLILNNVGEHIDLDMLGIPEPTPENGSKIILTTRSEQVCHAMDVNYLKIQLEDLLSWELFCEKVGDAVNYLSIQPVARQVVESCSHYSPAIVLMAGALRGVFDTHVWNEAFEKLSIQHASDDEKLESLMVSVLKFCWEHLEDDTTRNCFRNFVVHSKEQGTEGSGLIQHWITNGLIGTLEKGNQILKALIDVNLLESDDGGLTVKIGDVIRHVFVNLIIQPEECRLFLMRSGLGLTESPKDEEWENAKEIHLQENEFSVLPENLRCSVLSTLFLHRNKKLRTIPPSFFVGMQALQVLNLSRTRIKSLPDSLFSLDNLKRLYLNYCDHLRALPPKIGDLKQLEVLDMEGTEILTLPEEVKSLTALQCLEVSFYKGRRSGPVIPRGIISTLIRLEELNITVHPYDEGWDLCVGAIATEVFSLPRLSTLKLFFPRVELLRSLHSPSLSHFRITVGHHVSRIMSRIPTDVEFEAERWERCFRYVNGVHVLGDVQRLLQDTTFFYLDRHTTIEKLSEFGIENMEELKCCVLVECNELQVIVKGGEEETRDEIVSESEDNNRAALGSLEYLYVFHMKNLKKIREGPVQKCFCALKFLNLHTCPRLTTIFAREWIDDLCSLEELVVRDCPAVLSIVSCGDDPLKHDTYCFLPRLKRMSLCYMPGLVCISGGLYIAPRLECVSFYDCPNLETLLRDEEMSSNDLKKIKGERSWWEALEWIGGKPNHIDDIFVPIHGCDL